MSTVLAERFSPLPPERAALWRDFGKGEALFPALVGIVIEEVRLDYARMRLPFRPQLNQPAGVVHGGAIATLIDTVVVPAIGSAWDERRPLLTISMQINYLNVVAGEDAIAEGWVERRGRSLVFCRVEVRTARDALATSASLVYKI
ncbi:MAG: PaaI family thioesterase [Deltaproteobacteria bacterium]|nr:PaaI family thioesterase [Deltaproteobacteria bacterium]